MAAAAAPQPRAALACHHHLVLIVFTTTLAVSAAATRAAGATIAHTTTAAASSESSSSSSSSPAAASFLRDRCAATLFPALCYDSLLPYASEVHESPARLARAAADVAAARLRALSARVKDILRHGGADDPVPAPAVGDGGGAGGRGRPSETAALRDCASTVSAAASLAQQSSAELTKLEPDEDAAGAGSTTSSAAAAGGGTSSGGSRQARWEVSNAKTWLSAAMANEGTCADGLVEAAGATAAAAGSPAGKEVAAGVAAVRQYTSNALALVNGIPL